MQIRQIIIAISAVVAIGSIIGISFTDALEENVTFQELEIIPDPNRENLYSYIFNVCINDMKIEDPKIMVTSDMEKKGLQLTQVFNSDECFGAVEKIRAKDPDSIHTELVTYEISANVEDKKAEIERLKIEQERLQKELRDKLNNKFPEGGHQAHIDSLRITSDQLWAVNKDLQDKTAQFHAMQEYHHPDEFDE